jgi:hypothetical protein
METFGYLAVFYSIILGLAITRVFSGFAELINLRQTVRWYGPFIIWGAFLLFFAAWEWWVIFRWHTHRSWSFPLYGFLAIRPSLIYFATHLLLPEFESESRVDLREQLSRVRRWLFAIVGLAVLLGIADSALKGRDYFVSIWSWQWPLSTSLLSFAVIGIVLRAEWLQWLLPLLMLGVFAYFAIHSSPLQ